LQKHIGKPIKNPRWVLSSLRKREIDAHLVEGAHDLSALGLFQQSGFQQGMDIPVHGLDVE